MLENPLKIESKPEAILSLVFVSPAASLLKNPFFSAISNLLPFSALFVQIVFDQTHGHQRGDTFLLHGDPI